MTLSSPTTRADLCRKAWIGLDLTSDSDPKVAVCSMAWGRLRLRCHRWADAPEAVRRKAAKGLRCAAALPWNAALAVPLQPPPLPLAKRARILPGLLDLRLPFPLEHCTCAFHDTEAETVGFAVRQEDLRQTLADMAARGTHPERLLPLGWCLWREALREFPAEVDTVRAVLHVEPERWLLVTGQGTRFGTSATLRPSDPEGLRRTLQMAFGRVPESLQLLCVGPQATAQGQTAATALAAWNPILQTAAEPEFFVARAIAREAFDDPEGVLQLRQPPFDHPRALTPADRSWRRTAGVSLACGLLLLGASLGIRGKIRAQERDLANLLADRINTVAGYRVATRGTRAVEEAQAALDERLDPWTQRLLGLSASRRLAATLEAAHDCGAKVAHLALDDTGVSLSGQVPTPEAVEAFATRLRTAGLPTQAEIDARASKPEATLFLMTPEVRP